MAARLTLAQEILVRIEAAEPRLAILGGTPLARPHSRGPAPVTDAPPAAVVVLAAGEGTRMRSELPKVLHGFAGRSLLGHVLAAVLPLGAAEQVVVVAPGADPVRALLAAEAPQARPVVQDRPAGTGHAVRAALRALPDLGGDLLVVPGDAPLLTTATLRRLLAAHRQRSAAATLLTAVLPDPTGYGRVVREPTEGTVTAIVEHRDAQARADDETLAIREVATSVYAFAAGPLRAALDELTTDNAQAEEYLTDVIGSLAGAGRCVAAVCTEDADETTGVNDRVQLAAAAALMRDRLLAAHMRAGVTVEDPLTTWVDVGVRLEPDVTLLPGTRLHGTTQVGRGSRIGPDSTLRDTRVGRGAIVRNATCDGAEIGDEASVGPYTYLRPGTRLGRRAKAGAYVEVKAATLGEAAKVPHLSYVGDAEIGDRSNIGAATVFVNYDGVTKHRSTVGEDVRIGSDTMLVGPVHIGDGAYTAAGSVITEDVPPGALGLGRARQRTIDGWVESRRPGTPSAAAARRAWQARADQPFDEQRGVEP